MQIREIKVEDAEAFLKLCQQTDAESEFLLFEEGERDTTVEAKRSSIESMISSSNSTIFVVEDKTNLVGYLLARGGAALKNYHSVYIVIAILASRKGQGIGTELFKRLEEWARERDIGRLELGVMKTNHHALKLYQKMGFEIEGTKRNVFLVNDKYVDEYMMGKLLK